MGNRHISACWQEMAVYGRLLPLGGVNCGTLALVCDPIDGLCDRLNCAMGSASGGFADKIGGSYEALYVIAAALELIEGRLRSLQWEGLGQGFEGIEYRVCLNDGTPSVAGEVWTAPF